MQPQGASLESVERRMFTHVGSIGVCKYACVVADRLRLRRMMETRVMRKQYNMVQARRPLSTFHPHPLPPLLSPCH